MTIGEYRNSYPGRGKRIAGSESVAVAYLWVLGVSHVIGMYGLYVGGHPINEYTSIYALAALTAIGSICTFEYTRWRLSEKLLAPSTVIPPIVTFIVSLIQYRTSIIFGVPTEYLIAFLPGYWILVRIIYSDRDPDI